MNDVPWNHPDVLGDPNLSHEQLAARAYGIPVEHVTAQQRQYIKSLRFFYLYAPAAPLLKRLPGQVDAVTPDGKLLDFKLVADPSLPKDVIRVVPPTGSPTGRLSLDQPVRDFIWSFPGTRSSELLKTRVLKSRPGRGNMYLDMEGSLSLEMDYSEVERRAMAAMGINVEGTRTGRVTSAEPNFSSRPRADRSWAFVHGDDGIYLSTYYGQQISKTPVGRTAMDPPFPKSKLYTAIFSSFTIMETR